jgi:hypothetical protein
LESWIASIPAKDWSLSKIGALAAAKESVSLPLSPASVDLAAANWNLSVKLNVAMAI